MQAAEKIFDGAFDDVVDGDGDVYMTTAPANATGRAQANTGRLVVGIQFKGQNTHIYAYLTCL